MSKCYCKLQEEKIPPKPYVYEYGGVDASGLAAAKTESQDADGVVHGKTNVLCIIYLFCKILQYSATVLPTL